MTLNYCLICTKIGKMSLENELIMIEEIPKKIITVNFYRQLNGREPVREWLKSLKKSERKTIGEDIKKWYKKDGLWVCRWLAVWERDYGK